MIEGLKLTDEQIAQYVAMVNEHGLLRERNFGQADAIAFAAGAMTLFFATGQQDKIPGAWVLLAMMNKSPFYQEKK